MARRTKARSTRKASRATAKQVATAPASQQMSMRTRRVIFAVLALVIILMMIVSLAPGSFGPTS